MSDTIDRPFDAGDPDHVRDRARKAKRRDRAHDAVLGALMERAEGRAWLWELLGFCGVFQSSFAPNALEMARREGQRNVGLRLLAEINRVAPDGYMQMLKEQANE